MGENTVHQGHRARMKHKFALHGADVFDSYELLEMLLYFVLPYRDTNPPAHRLLSTFGSLDGVFSGSKEALASVEGIGERAAAFLLSVGERGKDALFFRGSSLECFDTCEKAARFFISRMKGSETPVLDVLFLDNRMCGIAAERLYETDFSSGAVNPTSCVRRALYHHASAVILAHNRLHGAFYPTESDRAGYRSFADALSLAGIREADHFLVVGKKAISLASFRRELHGFSALMNYIESYPRGGIYEPLSALPVAEQEESLFIDEAAFLSDFFSPITDPAGGSALSERLISRFGSAERVFSADIRALQDTDGVGEIPAFFIRLALALSSRRMTEAFPFGKPVSKAEIEAYFTSRFAGRQDEQVLMMTFDKDKNAIGVRQVSSGTVNSSGIDRRLCLETAVESGAASVILAHNHPGGTTDPSEEDIKATRSLADALLTVNIKLTDHYVVAGCRCDSVFNAPDPDGESADHQRKGASYGDSFGY